VEFDAVSERIIFSARDIGAVENLIDRLMIG